MHPIFSLILALIFAGIFVYSLVRFRRAILAEAEHVAAATTESLLFHPRRHPLVGEEVYYRHSGKFLGEVLHVDGSGRARILRYDGVIVRRSLHRITTAFTDRNGAVANGNPAQAF